jgi:hypothetical protein
MIPQPGADLQGCEERRRLQPPWRSQVARPSRRATAMLVRRAMAGTRSQAGRPNKKRRTLTLALQKRGSVYAFRKPQQLPSAVETSYN